MADYTGTTDGDVANHSSDTIAKTWDYSQGGSDILTGGSGADTFFMGSAYRNFGSGTASPNDLIDGGAGFGANVLELAGNYYNYRRVIGSQTVTFTSTLDLGPGTLKNMDTIKLDQGSGFGYRLNLHSGISHYGYIQIDGSSLTSAPLYINASGDTDILSVTTGTGSFQLVGGSANDFFYLQNGTPSGSTVDGGGGHDSVYLNMIHGGATLNLPDAAFANTEEFRLNGALEYSVTAGDAQTAADGTLTISLGSNDATLHFDGSAELNGILDVSGAAGNDILTGGGGDDILSGGFGGEDVIEGGAGADTLAASSAGTKRLTGGDGDDTINAVSASGDVFLDGGANDDDIYARLRATTTTRIDGGDGYDTAYLTLPSNVAPVTIDAGVLQNVEALSLNYGASGSGDSFSATWADGILSAGQVMPVGVGARNVRFNFDARAEAHGSFIFTLPGVNFGGAAGGNHWTGGSGNDVFIALNPSSNTGTGNVWDGGGGSNVLDYSTAGAGIKINAVAGTAIGTGSVGDSISHFMTYKFGAGNNSFTGADGSETLDLLNAGEETVHAGGGGDIIRLGATLDKFDLIDGGAGSDTVLLDGDYAAGVTLNTTTITNVETLKLAAGHAYVITASQGTVAAGQKLTVDGSALGESDTLTFNGSAETDGKYILNGGAGADMLTGGSGNDMLTGGSGGDSLSGLLGDDIYYVDNMLDNVTEANGEGTDIIYASVSYTLAGRIVETLSLTGAANINATGNDRVNTLNGNDGNNQLSGLGGNDMLHGGNGADILAGGAGDDLLDGGAHTDTATYADAGAAVTVSLAITAAQNTGGAGIDTLLAIEKVTGSAFGDHLTGDGGNNTLDGGAGADMLTGGRGNDIYYVDNMLDNVVEANDGGTDTVYASVSYTLAGRIVETLSLTGAANINATGNDRVNTLNGNDGNNLLSGLGGNDVLHGGNGADILAGGAGNDLLDGGAHTDTATYADATAAVTVSLAVAGAQNTGGGGTDTLVGIEKLTGSAYNDHLTGGGGNNTLDGGAGADVLTGGLGDDVYYVDNVLDNVVETDSQGTDLIYASVSYTLAGRIVETLSLTGTANIDATGNGRVNTLNGNGGDNVLSGLGGSDRLSGGAGDDTLIGGADADRLSGGSGADKFVFDTAPGGANIDTITDFSVADDTIVLNHSVFGLPSGALTTDAFFIGAAAQDANDRVIYDSGTGALWFDADGSGAGAAVQIAQMGPSLALTHLDILIG